MESSSFLETAETLTRLDVWYISMQLLFVALAAWFMQCVRPSSIYIWR